MGVGRPFVRRPAGPGFVQASSRATDTDASRELIEASWPFYPKHSLFPSDTLVFFSVPYLPMECLHLTNPVRLGMLFNIGRAMHTEVMRWDEYNMERHTHAPRPLCVLVG